MARPDFPKTVLEFQQRFATDEACADYLFRSRWPDGFRCPGCGAKRFSEIQTRRLYQCLSCGYQASVTAGTVMHRTRTPLSKWFWAAYLVTTHTPGFSALQFQRQAGIPSYETAFNMLHKLRAGMVRPEREKIHGKVEVDETYIGGPKVGRRGRGAEGKVIVAGAIEVVGDSVRRLRLRVVPDVSARSLMGFAKAYVERGSTVNTDDLSSYNGLSAAGYRHVVVGPMELEHLHRAFSNLKLWLLGTHHGVSPKHLQADLNEFVFRHNRRRTPMAAFQTVLGLGSHARSPTYAELYAVGRGGWVHPNPRGKSESRR